MNGSVRNKSSEEEQLNWIKQLSEFGLIVGGCLTLHHKTESGRWLDDDKETCHGKIGGWYIVNIGDHPPYLRFY